MTTISRRAPHPTVPTGRFDFDRASNDVVAFADLVLGEDNSSATALRDIGNERNMVAGGNWLDTLNTLKTLAVRSDPTLSMEESVAFAYVHQIAVPQQFRKESLLGFLTSTADIDPNRVPHIIQVNGGQNSFEKSGQNDKYLVDTCRGRAVYSVLHSFNNGVLVLTFDRMHKPSQD